RRDAVSDDRRQAQDLHRHGRRREGGRPPDRVPRRGSADPAAFRGRAQEERRALAHARDHLRLTTEAYQPDDVVLTTVGIDIGSSTSHLMLARLRLQRLADALSSRYVVVEREVLARSRVIDTPIRDGLIDTAALQVLIGDTYRGAKLAA